MWKMIKKVLTCWHPFSLTVKEVFSDSTSHSLINSSDFSVTPSHFPNSHVPPPVYHHTNLKLVTWQFSCALYFSFCLTAPAPFTMPLNYAARPNLRFLGLWTNSCVLLVEALSWLRCVEVGACCYWSSIVRQYHICNVLCTVQPSVQYTLFRIRTLCLYNCKKEFSKYYGMNILFTFPPFRKWCVWSLIWTWTVWTV